MDRSAQTWQGRCHCCLCYDQLKKLASSAMSNWKANCWVLLGFVCELAFILLIVAIPFMPPTYNMEPGWQPFLTWLKRKL